MSEDRRAKLKVWENNDEEDEALEADYMSLMEWWKSNPAPKLLLIHEMFEMVTKAKFWVWYCNDQDQDQDQDQDKRILDMKDFLQQDIFYNEENDEDV